MNAQMKWGWSARRFSATRNYLLLCILTLVPAPYGPAMHGPSPRRVRGGCPQGIAAKCDEYNGTNGQIGYILPVSAIQEYSRSSRILTMRSTDALLAVSST
jgi:hypothetical protein